jgi:glycosyltransferase involved in cell wall biosynthesis
MDIANKVIFPRISLVLPSFNQSEFLEETIKSILDQRYENLEFMILDGASTDGSVEIIKQYADKLTYWQSKPDKGQADALIQGFKRASGDIFGWVNSDDILFPGALEHIANAYLRCPQPGIFAGNYVLIDQQGKVIRCKRHPRESGWFGTHGLQVVSPEWFYTKKAYEKVGGLDINFFYSMDLDLYMKMIMEGVKYVYIDRELIGFRVHEGSKTTAIGFTSTEEDRIVAARLKKEYNVNFKSMWIIWIYRFFQLVNGNYFRMLMKTLVFRGYHWQNYIRKIGYI